MKQNDKIYSVNKKSSIQRKKDKTELIEMIRLNLIKKIVFIKYNLYKISTIKAYVLRLSKRASPNFRVPILYIFYV